MKTLMAATALTSLALVGITTFAQAEDQVLKYRFFAHTVSAQSLDVGDVDGHAIISGKQAGIVQFADGSIAQMTNVFSADYTKGTGQSLVYLTLLLDDGSALYLKDNVNAKAEGDITKLDGTVTVLGGLGKYEGAKGDGTMSGTRLAPLETGAELYVDFTLNIKK